MSLGGELPLGAGLNAQWARLTSSHPLLAPVSRPRWPDILPCPRCSPWASPNEATPPFTCGRSSAGVGLCVPSGREIEGPPLQHAHHERGRGWRDP